MDDLPRRLVAAHLRAVLARGQNTEWEADMAGPTPGTVEDGYIFLGGDPSQQTNWRPVKSTSTADAKAIADLREEAARKGNFASQAQQFMQLNRETGTGPGRSFGLGTLMPSQTSSNIQAMQAIASRAAPAMRAPGSGATSDKDMSLYLASFPKVTNWGGSNQQITRTLSEDASRSAARAAFVEKWAQVNGNIVGADAAFDKYWSSRGNRPAAKPAQLPGPNTAPRPKSGAAALSDDQIKKALGF